MKKQKRFIPYLFMTIVVLMMQGCNLPSATPTQELTPELLIDPLVAAQLTITAAAEQPPLVEPSATFTPPPTLSPTVESTLTPAFTSTPTFAYLTLSEATNCRIGPSTEFEKVDTFLVGQTIEVVGKHPFDNYWYVRNPNNSSAYCWMWGQYATGGNLNNVPILTPPPTHTPSPELDFTVNYVDSGKCIGWWTRLKVKNTGGIPLKSISITVKDTVTDETRSETKNGFQDVNACVLSSLISVLDSGNTHTVVAPSFSANPAGHKVKATVKLCTQVDLGGVCASQTIEFTP